MLGVILADRSRPEKGTVLADAPMLLAIVDEGDLFFDYWQLAAIYTRGDAQNFGLSAKTQMIG